MAEIREDGYITLRTFIAENWDTLSLQDETGNEVISINLTEDNWIHDKETKEVWAGYDGQNRPVYEDVEIETNQTMEIQVIVTGEDVETLPSTVAQSVIKGTSGTISRDVSVETFQPFTFESTGDELTITHKINVPQLG